MSKQKTAVEWLFEQIPAEWSSSKSAFDAYQQAKQMGEEQIKEAWNKKAILTRPNHYCIDSRDAEQYYDETFKS
jgi:hypothetical protein